MKKPEYSDGTAPEQYELREVPAYEFAMDRRKFFKVMGSGIAITFSAAHSLGAVWDGPGKPADDTVGAWIHIDEEGKVSIYTGKAEVGQNIRTSLAQIVAEELSVPMDRIEMILGDTDITPYDRGTFGSRSIPYMGPQLRKAAATAREIVLEMAAAEWKVEKRSLFIREGIISSNTLNKSVPIGRLAGGKEMLQPVDERVAVTPASQWKVAGTSVLKVNGASFVTGRHRFVSDLNLPGMLYGKILRAPAYGATLVSADTAPARKMKDVVVVQDRDFIGVAALHPDLASRALAAIKAEWKTAPQVSHHDIFVHLRKTGQAGRASDSGRDVDTVLSSSEIRISQTFHIDYIAHAPLEPRAGVARWSGNSLTVWVGTQRPFGVREELEKVFDIPAENIRVIMPDTGSGYGGKHTGEAGIEAARLAKEAGRPVKVVWTREEEFTWAYFRPAGVIEVQAGATKGGKVTAWDFHNYNSGASGIETPYAVAHKRISFHPSDSPLRQGSYRGLAATANVFAREAIMDDIASAAGLDPLQFRLNNLEEPRMKDVLEAAAAKFEWSRFRLQPGRGRGIACGTEKGSFIATCAEISFDAANEEVKVERVVAAFECGAIVNPEHLKNQIQGSVVQGIGGALFEWIDFRDGKIVNPLFSRYRVPRFSDMPALEVVMLDRKDIPSLGAGETPILAIAPAIRNAIAHATGKKLYTLPLVPNGLKT